MATRQTKSASSGSTAPSRHEEIETKLEIAAEAVLPDLTRIREHGIAGVGEPLLFELDALYYDTAGLDLLAAKMTLRRRTGGEDAGWHLKLPAVSGARTEVALPLGDEATAQQVPAALADLVSGAARGRDLRPVARIQNSRTVRRLIDSEGTELIEIADDHVTATDLTGEMPAESRWRELEAEVLQGNREQLAVAVDALIKAGATPASSASKLARALHDSAAQAGTGQAKRDKSVGAAIVTALTRLRDAMIATDRPLREGTSQAIHDARAAARRVRSVLGVYAPLFEKGSVDELRTALRDHGRILSAARDLEVLEERLDRQLDDEPAEYTVAARARLKLEFASRGPVALASIGDWIRSADYYAMLRDLDTFVAAPPFSPRAAKPAAHALPALLTKDWERLSALADTAISDPTDVTALHTVRKRAKGLRYAAEAAVATLGEPAVVFAAAVEQIQEVLGEHQDAVNSAALLAELALDPATDGTAGFVFGRLHAFEEAVAHGSIDDFTDAWDRVADPDLIAALSGE